MNDALKISIVLIMFPKSSTMGLLCTFPESYPQKKEEGTNSYILKSLNWITNIKKKSDETKYIRS